MQLNSDFSRRVVVLPGDYQFVDSPLAGVSRMMLDRAGAEVARATSIVRYAPGSGYSSHRHDDGEEILVLDGVFSDEHGEYPAGSWLRNPRYSDHTPYTGPEGALIYVKVGHMGAGLLGDKFIQPE
uniref:cupin domain-containing protein n=1 Tax=Rheinheimera sp. TaxID=1869214 RepID=UPI00404873BF